MRLSAELILAALLLTAAFPGRAGADEDSRSFQTVVVKPGETLWDISRQYLKDPARWDEIIKHNTLPSADPTVALPGMSLRVPLDLIKEELRAAVLIALSNEVSVRRKDAAQWAAAHLKMQLFRDDTLRTQHASMARVRFDNSDILELPADAMAVIKPKHKDYLVELKNGGSVLTRSKVLTASAMITPQTKDTKYLARVKDDLSTVVQVVKGKALVEAQQQKVEVDAGLQTEVHPGAAPTPPTAIPDLPSFEKSLVAFETGKSKVALAPAALPPAAAVSAPKDSASPASALARLRVGQPISGYRVQFSDDPGFANAIFDRNYDADVPFEPEAAPLPAGIYWYRVSVIDLLGSPGKWSKPQQWTRK